jgi:CRISPR system Cascade subunit CasE
MSESALHLLHMRPNPQRLAAWAAKHHLIDQQGDLGYALHGLLSAAFGQHAPKPFRYLGPDAGLLAYTQLLPDQIKQLVALADVDVATALGLGATLHDAGLSIRPFPDQWPSGLALGFEVRVRPVIRENKSGNERDAFLVAVEKSNGADLSREQVYVQWLRDQLSVRNGGAPEPWQGAVRIVDAHLQQFHLQDLTLRYQRTDADSDSPRKRRSVAGPDATITGRLEVIDSAAFRQLLIRGVGRHRSFGFGLLLLRPVAR